MKVEGLLSEKQGWDSTLINSVGKSTMFHFSPITVDTEGETCRWGCLFMQEAHREAASPRSLPLCLASCVGNERTNATMWHKVSLFPQQPIKHALWQSRSEETRQSNRGNEMGGMFISPELMGRVSLCMSQMPPDYFFWMHTCTHPVCIISTWLIHRAASMDLVIPRCCHDQDLRLLKPTELLCSITA